MRHFLEAPKGFLLLRFRVFLSSVAEDGYTELAQFRQTNFGKKIKKNSESFTTKFAS